MSKARRFRKAICAVHANGPEPQLGNFGKGMTHCIVLEFASVEDRAFYLLEDPVYRAFSVKTAPLIETSVVVGKACTTLAEAAWTLLMCLLSDFVNGSLLGPSPRSQA